VSQTDRRDSANDTTQLQLRRKTHGAKIGADFRQKSWRRRCCCIMHFCSCKSEQKERAPRPNWNVVTTILYYLPNKPNKKTMDWNQSHLFLSITCFRKSTSE